jgi:cytochrome c551/c552
MIDGKPTEIAVDSNGVAIGTANNTTPRLDTVVYDSLTVPAQAALTSAMPGVKIEGKDPVRVFMLCNGVTYYLTDRTADGKPGEGLLDVNGAPVTVAADFSTIPEAAQNALRGLAKGNIAATQPVQVFQDAEPYDVYCAAYCGTNHSIMRSRVIVHRSQADFDRWLAEATQRDFAGPPKDRGEKLYRKLGCAQCHTIDGTKLVGPSWKDVWGKTETLTGGAKVLVDKAYVTESILQPQAKIVDGFPPSMPPFVLKDEQIGWIIAFLQSISVHTSAAERAALNGAASQPAGGPATRPAGGAVPATGGAVPAASGAVPATQK